jgi:hypothetical protein
MRITVPEDKMRKAEEVATDLQSREIVTLKQVQSAVGYFNHVASAASRRERSSDDSSTQ